MHMMPNPFKSMDQAVNEARAAVDAAIKAIEEARVNAGDREINLLRRAEQSLDAETHSHLIRREFDRLARYLTPATTNAEEAENGRN